MLKRLPALVFAAACFFVALAPERTHTATAKDGTILFTATSPANEGPDSCSAPVPKVWLRSTGQLEVDGKIVAIGCSSTDSLMPHLQMAGTVEARAARVAPVRDVKVRVGLRDVFAVRYWLGAYKATSIDEQHALLGLVDALNFQEVVDYLAKTPKFDVDKMPNAPRVRSLSKAEAQLLTKALASSPERPMDGWLVAMLTPLRDDVQALLDGIDPYSEPPVAAKAPAKKGTP